MAEFSAFEGDIEVSGRTALSVLEGMGGFREHALRILAEHGIPDPDPEAWVPQQAWLDAFRYIAERIGPNTLYAIGCSIPRNARFPEAIRSIDEALASIDVAYHMNHRRAGQVMYDPDTGRMTEGIGHYLAERRGPRWIRVICHNPYPCHFDRGIVAAMAERHRPADAVLVRVETPEGSSCRRRGDEVCIYDVTW